MGEELIAGVCSSWWCSGISNSFDGVVLPAAPASCSVQHGNCTNGIFNWASGMVNVEQRSYRESPPPTSAFNSSLAFQDIHMSHVSSPSMAETWSHQHLVGAAALIQGDMSSGLRLAPQDSSSIQSNYHAHMENSSLIDSSKNTKHIFSVESSQLYEEGFEDLDSQLQLNNCNSFVLNPRDEDSDTKLYKSSSPQQKHLQFSSTSTSMTTEAPWPRELVHHAFDESFVCSSQKSSSSVGDSTSIIEKRSDIEPALKKPRIETPSSLPTFKVRKEKLGDRITALQQLVSPFGKTDTASVLHEAIDYINFLHDQVRGLSAPYLRNRQQTQAEEQEDLESRGLCLLPVSTTFSVARGTPMDFWTPFLGGTFR
ncbi:hypothetical protein Cni_G13887 [Canna indica]|uniref:BHLH domain-containing protein n=1 Tax=Canna indica TaxID=4628 RepID=A0AAQ3QD41_9LILI|nr:hypothetical protein Cni_G13887 [Canna indica]